MTRCAKATGAGITASHLLMELPAISLSQQAGKCLVIPQTAGCAITGDLASAVYSPGRMTGRYINNVPARDGPMDSPLLRSEPFALSEVGL